MVRFGAVATVSVGDALLCGMERRSQMKHTLPVLTEYARDERGRIIWRRRYLFRRLNGPGDGIIANHVSYTVVSSRLVGKRVETVLRRDES